MAFTAVILAAGKGTRMASPKPKALQTLAGKPLIVHLLDTLTETGISDVVIIHSSKADEEFKKEIKSDQNITYVEQERALGTAHALQTALPHVSNENLLVFLGDVPLLSMESIIKLRDHLKESNIAVLTASVVNPKGYGRINRDKNGKACSIIEDLDCSEEQKRIKEINSGIMAFRTNTATKLIEKIKPNTKKNEYFLTDAIEIAYHEGLEIKTYITIENEVFGVNSKKDLAKAEKINREQVTTELMEGGVTILDPGRVDVRGTITCGKDVTIDVNTIFIGDIVLGDGVTIGPFSVISDSKIGSETNIYSHSHIEGASIGSNCNVGPFARIRPETKLDNGVKVGNFVETKKSTIGKGSKVNHLSYIGDAEIGEESNIGAGTITCNYDGANKHQTNIGNKVFIGSGVELVAPITVEDGATIGAGSTVSKNAPEEKLTIERSKQKTIEGWNRPTKNEEKK
jgi:bifunctional UDP-N-acetylglucosamine pyrophosphorylase/glucosamine-1-phosphate N-acetyltransferase